VVATDNGNFLGTLNIAGVALSLENGGRFGEAAHFTLHDGCTLAVSIGASAVSLLDSAASITLSCTTLR